MLSRICSGFVLGEMVCGYALLVLVGLCHASNIPALKQAWLEVEPMKEYLAEQFIQVILLFELLC